MAAVVLTARPRRAESLMQALLDLRLPAALPPLTTAVLVAASALTSAVTASLGIGGGVLLLAILAIAMPPGAIIPVHGMVQLGSNLSRASMTLRHINLRLILWFAPGALLGAWLGSLFLVDRSEEHTSELQSR